MNSKIPWIPFFASRAMYYGIQKCHGGFVPILKKKTEKDLQNFIKNSRRLVQLKVSQENQHTYSVKNAEKYSIQRWRSNLGENERLPTLARSSKNVC